MEYFKYHVVDADGKAVSVNERIVCHSNIKDSNLKFDFFSQAVELIDSIEFHINDLTVENLGVKLPLRVEYVVTKVSGIVGYSPEVIQAIQKIYESIKEEFATDLDELRGAWVWFAQDQYAGRYDFNHDECADRFIECMGLEMYREYIIKEFDK